MSKTRQVTTESKEMDVPPFKDKPILVNQDDKAMVEWRHINWHQLEKRVYKLQKRIYRASLRGDVYAVRRLQRTLMKSWSAKCLAVRRVTQDNQEIRGMGVKEILAHNRW